MKKMNKKVVIIAIILVISLIFFVKLFSDSKANEVIELTVNITDIEGCIEDITCTLQALNENDSMVITLPDIVSNKKVEKYLIEEKKICEDTYSKESLSGNESINITEENNDMQEKIPGNQIYLTEEEVKNKVITLNAKYETIKKDEIILYNQVMECQEDENTISVTGFMPSDSRLDIKKVSNEELSQMASEHINENTTVKVAYDIKIISNGEEFEPNTFDENIEVTIIGIDAKDKDKKEYKVIHINDQDEVENIENIQVNENSISFRANSFSTYAVLAEDVSMLAEETIETYASSSAIIQTDSQWDGTTIATGFSWGNGSEQEPYLIADGEELAYLATQVRNGNGYDGIYFQLACDIDLGNNEWTPIGDTENSFRGIFDGAGHTIANAKITIGMLPSDVYESYGIFGSIGNGNTRTIIRNLEISDININITASGSTGSFWQGQGNEGYHIGTMVGSLYNNASLLNVIAKDSSVIDTNQISIYNSGFHLSVGGVVGYVTNTPTSDTDPGKAARYAIENCYSDTTITLDSTGEVSNSILGNRNGRGHYHTGGIVGTIRSQPVWPNSCLYRGKISSNGFIGPIFGALINNTTYSSANNFATIWNGNDAGNLSANQIYYSGYTAAGKSFTQSVISGNSTARVNNQSSNIGYVQGVNKGIYTTDMTSIYNIFNSKVTSENKYLNWIYQDDTFSFKERLTTTVIEPAQYTYEISVTDPYQIGNYTYRWYKNNVEDTSIQTTYVWEPNYNLDENMVVVTYDGTYYTVSKFLIKRISVDIVFNIDKTNNSVTATLEGEGMKYTTVDDYTFKWYKEDLSGEAELLDGKTALYLDGLEEGYDYRLVATNTKIPKLTTENDFTYGDRVVVYVDYNLGNNNNDGFTDTTPVKTLDTAYSKLDSNGNRNKNVIVIMGTYSNNNYMTSATDTTYSKPVTITGKYRRKNYNGTMYFYSSTSSYRYLTADTTFQNLDFYGNGNQMYLYLQGYSLTMGENITMLEYANANSNQGLLGNNAPAFHIICGWLRYNYATLPRNNANVLIKSGTYGRIIGGGSPGTSGSANLQQNTSHNFMGSSMSDSFKLDITVDIKNSTTSANYDYDINLLVGGSACGNNYSRVTENIKSGTIGRVLGGSIGDSSDRPNNWNYPINTFLGDTTININGGTIAELYGGCLGRNMGAIDGGWNASTIVCDSYFYGTITVNMYDGEIINNIYGAGAGGVTGYSENSSDQYKNYGSTFATSVNLNLSGGKIGGNIYGGGYGYTEYLTEDVTAVDAGALYGNSNIVISGDTKITGNIYAAGRGYSLSSKPNLAQMEGISNIEITGTPTIEGKIFGAGEGIFGYEEMAKLTGVSNIKIDSDLAVDVFGGGNIAKTSGETNISIESGNHTADIYGGGNVGIIEGTSTVNINGGTQSRVFGGGNQAQVTTSIVNVSRWCYK